MKLEGIVYFIGVAIGIMMLKLFYGTPMLLPKAFGIVALAMGCFGYLMMVASHFKKSGF